MAAVAVALLLLLIAASLPFDIKDPVLTISNLTVKELSFQVPLHVNVTLAGHLSVYNPNPADFSFNESTTRIFYHEHEVATAISSTGEAPANGTFDGDVTVEFIAERVLKVPQLLGDLARGKLPLELSTRIGGSVAFFGAKQNLDLELNCTMSLNVLRRTVDDPRKCTHRVWVDSVLRTALFS